MALGREELLELARRGVAGDVDARNRVVMA